MSLQTQYSFPQEHRERADRMSQFANILADVNMPLTVREVARFAGMAKSHHVRSILDEMVEMAILECEAVQTFRTLPTKLYRISESARRAWLTNKAETTLPF